MDAKIRGRQPARNVQVRPCANCGDNFQPYREYQRACSRKCRDAIGPMDERERIYPTTFQCRKCGSTSTRMHTIKGGRFYFCLECEPAAVAERKERKNQARRIDPDAPRKARKVNLKRAYGITLEDYDAMLLKQDGGCMICGDPPKPGGVGAASRLHVDHDHESGKVRGLLCNHCNRGLGAFRDRPELLELAVLYLRSFR